MRAWGCLFCGRRCGSVGEVSIPGADKDQADVMRADLRGCEYMLRLDKYLADAGVGTRSEVKKLLRSGRVKVNGQVIKTAETKVDPQADSVTVDGKPVEYEQFVWYMVHKDAGCVTAVKDNLHRTVMQLLPEEAAGRKGLAPVGRLDLDTEGLLLITDDGDTAHRLLSPSRHVPKTYFALLGGEQELTARQAAAFESGLDIGDEKPTAPAGLQVLPWTSDYEALLPDNEVPSADEGTLRPDNEVPSADEGTLKTDNEVPSADEGTLRCDNEEPSADEGMPLPDNNARMPVEERLLPHAAEHRCRSAVLATIREGRYHQVKRMFQAIGQEVLYLKRTSFGPLELDPALKKGCARKLTKEEIRLLAEAVGLSGKAGTEG